jgi:hypothetical protein
MMDLPFARGGVARARLVVAFCVLVALPARASPIEFRFASVSVLGVESFYRLEEGSARVTAENEREPRYAGAETATAVSTDPVFGRSAFDRGRSDVCHEGDGTLVGMLAGARLAAADRARGADLEPRALEPPIELRPAYYPPFASAQSRPDGSPERLEIEFGALPLPGPPSIVLALIGGSLFVFAAGRRPPPPSTRPAPPRYAPRPIVCRRYFGTR